MAFMAEISFRHGVQVFNLLHVYALAWVDEVLFFFFVFCISDNVSPFHICSQLFYPHLGGALVLFPDVTGKKTQEIHRHDL